MWTSMPPMTIGILDQDATDSLLLSNPELYKQGRLGIKNHLSPSIYCFDGRFPSRHKSRVFWGPLSPNQFSFHFTGLSYKAKLFWINMFDAFYVSLVIFFVSYGAYYGTNVGHYEFGTTLLTTHLAVMFLNLAVVTKSWVCNQKKKIIVSSIVFFKKSPEQKTREMK